MAEPEHKRTKEPAAAAEPNFPIATSYDLISDLPIASARNYARENNCRKAKAEAKGLTDQTKHIETYRNLTAAPKTLET